jgi:hypothetical protein
MNDICCEVLAKIKSLTQKSFLSPDCGEKGFGGIALSPNESTRKCAPDCQRSKIVQRRRGEGAKILEMLRFVRLLSSLQRGEEALRAGFKTHTSSNAERRLTCVPQAERGRITR